jgi:hypothetical protein
MKPFTDDQIYDDNARDREPAAGNRQLANRQAKAESQQSGAATGHASHLYKTKGRSA